jgi:hemolysin III
MKLREPMNGATHFVGILLAIISLPILVVPAAKMGKTLHVVSFSIFSSSMILLYSSSTIYHWANVSAKKLKTLRKVDHIMIFVMIAGSYTPITLIGLKGGWGWSLFGVSWGITIIGLFLKLFWLEMPRKLYVGLYLLMGWIVLIAIYPLSKSISAGALNWLLIEGGFYSVGAIIYTIKKPDFKYFGFHEIWHIFVLLGSFAQFMLLYKHILYMD